MSETDPRASEKFSLTWDALKLLGKNLYSHPWSAISELAANGLDANAKEVIVHLDMSLGKDKARLEVFDDGVGMDEERLKAYVKIGYKKRENSADHYVDHPMGRKGIGKLAALYLSDLFYLLTKTKSDTSIVRKVDVKNTGDEDHPQLMKIDLSDAPQTTLKERWHSAEHGTLIQIENINLKGYGDKAFEALGERLANQFLTSSLTDALILYQVTDEEGNTQEPAPVEKKIAYGNLLFVRHRFTDDHPSPDGWDKIQKGRELDLESGRKPAKGSVEVASFSSKEHKLQGKLPNHPDISYSLSGWLGMHATIKNELAQENDKNFSRNQYYNPGEVRLYVRNKLAIANVLPLIGSTQTYSNYIEGEISFDVLDDDKLPDIATTSREGFDDSDERITLLKTLLKEQVQSLIAQRNRLNEQLKTERGEQVILAGKQVVKDIITTLEDHGVDKDVQNKVERQAHFSMKKNRAEAKEEYKVFLSHARKNKSFSDLIEHLLQAKGATADDIFYTSRSQTNIDAPENLTPLEEQICESITDVNTRIAYVTSNEFISSLYCLFEAGAGWATRGVDQYDIFPATYDSCPAYLHKGQPLKPFADGSDNVQINRDSYLSILIKVNKLIDHINKGRSIAKKPELEKYEVEGIPSDIELRRLGKDIETYMDQDVLESFKVMKDLWSREATTRRDERIKDDKEAQDRYLAYFRDTQL